MDPVPKVRWADIPDDAPLPVWPPPEKEEPPPVDVIVSKHGIKVARLRPPDKTKPLGKSK